VEIDMKVAFDSQKLLKMFKAAIASALDVSLEHVVKLSLKEIGQDSGARRLQATHTKRYEVRYEVIPPSSADVDMIVAKANLISTSGSSESKLFRQALEAVDGVVQVGQILTKVAAHKVEDGTTPAPVPTPELEDEDSDKISWVSLIIGSIVVCLMVLCLITSVIFIKRKRANSEANAASGNSSESSVNGVIFEDTSV